MPVNEKINFQLATFRNLCDADDLRPVTVCGLDETGRAVSRTFNSRLTAEQWLSTHEATAFELVSIL